MMSGSCRISARTPSSEKSISNREAEAPPDPGWAPELPLAQAERFAAMALACVHREYPNKIAHELAGPEDVAGPRQLTPAFYGCFDWHSAVHGHWLLARLARRRGVGRRRQAGDGLGGVGGAGLVGVALGAQRVEAARRQRGETGAGKELLARAFADMGELAKAKSSLASALAMPPEKDEERLAMLRKAQRLDWA